MRQPLKRLLWSAGILMALALLAGLLLPAILSRGWESGPQTAEERRHQNIGILVSAVRQYAGIHDGRYPYSPAGSDAALKLVADEHRGGDLQPRLRWVDAEAVSVPPDDFAYLYLNPLPDEQLSRDTIILAERECYYGDGTLFVATESGQVALLESISRPPEDILGAKLSELPIKRRYPEVVWQ